MVNVFIIPCCARGMFSFTPLTHDVRGNRLPTERVYNLLLNTTDAYMNNS